MNFFNTRKYFAPIFIFMLLLFVTSCARNKQENIPSNESSSRQSSWSASASDEIASVTGIVMDATMNTIMINADGEEYFFGTEGAKVIALDGILIDDQATVYYSAAEPKNALKIDVIENGKNHHSDYQVYEVKGTAPSIQGVKWDNMVSQRKESTNFAQKYRDLVYVNLNPNEKAVFLTFDDGPDATNTLSVMNTLIKKKVGATFFFTGENIKNNSAVVKKVHENGFAIGLHGYDHTSLAVLKDNEVKAQLNNTNDLLEKITGERTNLMRPPYGDINDSTIEIIGQLKQKIYLWSLDTLDWAQSDKAEILRNIKENLRPGDIILMHASYGKSFSAEILPEVIDYIKTQGYELKALPK